MAQKKKEISKTAEKVAPASPKGKTGLWILIGVLILVVGLYQAINLRWISDDAFITYRYVQNFVAGHGIVYNVGEYVEGYTHFLWLLILSAAKFIGFDPVDASIWLGIAAYALTLCIYILITHKEQKRLLQKAANKFYLPLAAILLALNYDMNIWASGGLETSLYTFLISLSFYLWFYTKIVERKKLLTVGSILLLATLTRPDGALFLLTAAGLLAVQGLRTKMQLAQNLKRVGFLVLPSLLIGIPYLLWKYNYYGDIFPTPYYAKSASENYFAQGFFYISLFFRAYISLVIALIAGIVIYAAQIIKKKKIGSPISHIGSPFVASSAAVIVYLILYIARVGGDFMFARFMIPVLPLMYFLVEGIINKLPGKIFNYRLVICIAFIAMTFLERRLRDDHLFHFDAATSQLSGNWSDDEGGGATRGIADERWVYTRKRFAVDGELRGSLDVYCDIGKYYEPIFAGLPLKAAIMGGQNSIAYYANFANCIDVYGLTDKYIAHLPISKRGRIGHEKEAPPEYLKKRGVNLEFFAVGPNPPQYFSFNIAAIEIPQFHSWQIIQLINYDDTMMKELAVRLRSAKIRAIIPVYDEVMTYYMKEVMQKLPASEVLIDYNNLEKIFWDKHPDPLRKKAIFDYIEQKKKDEAAKK